MNAVTIRPYEASDQAGVEWLYARTPPWGRSYPRPEPVPEELRRVREAFAYAVVAVAPDRAGEAVVGLTTVRDLSEAGGVPMPDSLDTGIPAARLQHVLVAPERWRRGIGRRLVEDAVSWARNHGYRAVVLDTTAEQEGAVAFYRALGFQEAARTRFREWELVWFLLRLDPAGPAGTPDATRPLSSPPPPRFRRKQE